MLHIVLFLLKIIGIILASILGLLLFLILVVLLVPIRYRINADNMDEIRAEAKVSWLLRIIYIQIMYLDNQLIIRLRLFGKIFYDSSNVKEKKQIKKARRLKTFKKPLKKNGIHTEIKKEKIVKVKSEIKPAEIKKVQEETKSTDVVIIKKDQNQTIIDETQSVKKSVDITEIQPDKEKAETVKTLHVSKPDEIIKTQRNNPPTEANNTEKIMKAAEISNSKANYSEAFTDDSDHVKEELPDAEHKGIFAGIKRFFHKIKSFFTGIKNWFFRLKNRILNLKEQINTIGEKWNKIKAFLKDEENKKAFSMSLKTLKRVFRHVRPTKLKLELEFGTGDPCSTGQALGVLAIFYGYYGKSMQVIPNFEEEILKGSIFCIGRIRLFTLLIICIQLILDKNFRNLLKNFKTLKEDL